MTDRALMAVREAIGAAVARHQPLSLRGTGSKDFYGQPAAGEPLPLDELQGIVGYEPTELVITAWAGTPLADVCAALAERQQFLPFEPPQFGAGGTIGGVVASGLSGPRRAAAGSVRDYVLGTCLIDARGQWLQFGGQVMKNVAGYDVSRLLVGSMGILGVIAQVSLKVMPVPPTERSVQIDTDELDALRLMNQWAARPLPISATCWHEGVLRIRFSGAGSVVDQSYAQFVDRHGARELDDDKAWWARLRDQRLAFFADDVSAPLWRLSVPSVAPRIDLPGGQIIEWAGALRWWRTSAPVDAVRRAAAAVGGTATLFRGGDKSVGVFTALPDPLARIHRRLKAEFDPLGVFNPGRLYPGL